MLNDEFLGETEKSRKNMKKGVDKSGAGVYYMQALWGAGPEQVKKLRIGSREERKASRPAEENQKNLKKGLDKPNSL